MKNKSSFFLNNYLKLSVLILLYFAYIANLNAQWESCNNGITKKDAVWCFAIDGNNTYTGITGGVFMSSDNGDNWVAKNKGLTITMMPDTAIGSLAINENNIFAGTGIDGIFQSTDKGENWVQKSNGLYYDSIHLAIIHTLKIINNHIFTGTDKGVYLSTDNGENWIPKNNGLPQHYDSILNETSIGIYTLADIGNYIYAGTVYGVYLTTNNGNNWIAKNKSLENLIILSLATNGNNIYAGTEFGGLFLSIDRGDNWENIGFNGYTITEIITYGNNIIVSGYGINLSTDNGKSWISQNSGLPGLFVISMIINGDFIFAGVNNYGIYRAKLSDLGITDVKETEQTTEIIILPNPTSDEFRLRFQTPTETTVQLSVFDLLGNCVLSQALPSTEGTNEKNINCGKLPQGYYFVKINMNEVVETVPLVIIK